MSSLINVGNVSNVILETMLADFETQCLEQALDFVNSECATCTTTTTLILGKVHAEARTRQETEQRANSANLYAEGTAACNALTTS